MLTTFIQGALVLQAATSVYAFPSYAEHFDGSEFDAAVNEKRMFSS